MKWTQFVFQSTLLLLASWWGWLQISPTEVTVILPCIITRLFCLFLNLVPSFYLALFVKVTMLCMAVYSFSMSYIYPFYIFYTSRCQNISIHSTWAVKHPCASLGAHIWYIFTGYIPWSQVARSSVCIRLALVDVSRQQSSCINLHSHWGGTWELTVAPRLLISTWHGQPFSL